MKRVLSILIVFSLFFAVVQITPVNAVGTQPIDEFTPYRESEHFLFDVPSRFLTGNITPEQLGWYLGEMDKLYKAMANFVGGKTDWLPEIRPFSKYDTDKVVMIYQPSSSGGTIGTMSAMPGVTEIYFNSDNYVRWTVEEIKKGLIFDAPVHELGHVFGAEPRFNMEWLADFLKMYASITTGIKLKDSHINGMTFESWYQWEYNYQNNPWLEERDYNTRYGSILNCAILDLVRDHGWNVMKQVFGSYHDGSYPYHGKKYSGIVKAVRFNDFIDAIDYFSGVDFRSQYLDNEDWLEYINGLFPVEPIEYVTIAGIEYVAHDSNMQLNNLKLTDADIEALEHLTHLTVLGLSKTKPNLTLLCDVLNRDKPMSKASRLLQLSLSYNEITDISPLNRISDKVRYLDLSNNQITDISALKEFTELTTLYLNDNQITDFSHFKGMTNLEILYLKNNLITDISSLSSLPNNLRTLYLNNNLITDISPLSSLPNNLRALDLSGNRISDISPLSSLPNMLTSLYLNNNQITDLRPLRGMGNFAPPNTTVSLNLTNNPVTLAQVNALKLTMPENAKITHNAVCNGCCDTFCNVCWSSPCVCPPATTSTTTPEVTTTPNTTTMSETTSPLSETTPHDTTVTFVTTTSSNTTAPLETTTPPITTEPEPDYIIGRIISIDSETSIFDALEILKALVGMESKATNNPAALITEQSKLRGEPDIFDALEILKMLVGMENEIIK